MLMLPLLIIFFLTWLRRLFHSWVVVADDSGFKKNTQYWVLLAPLYLTKLSFSTLKMTVSTGSVQFLAAWYIILQRVVSVHRSCRMIKRRQLPILIVSSVVPVKRLCAHRLEMQQCQSHWSHSHPTLHTQTLKFLQNFGLNMSTSFLLPLNRMPRVLPARLFETTSSWLGWRFFKRSSWWNTDPSKFPRFSCRHATCLSCLGPWGLNSGPLWWEETLTETVDCKHVSYLSFRKMNVGDSVGVVLWTGG